MMAQRRRQPARAKNNFCNLRAPRKDHSTENLRRCPDTDVARRRTTVLVRRLAGFTATSRDPILLISVSHQEARNRSSRRRWRARATTVTDFRRRRGTKPSRRRRDWRMEIDKAARSVGGSHSLRNQRPPRPVQTGGGRSVTPSSTQLVSLGRLLLFG